MLHKLRLLLQRVGRIRYRSVVVIACLLTFAAWLSVTADFCAEQAKNAMISSRWSVADRWLKIGGYCRGSRVRLWVMRARISNKRGNFDEFESALIKAKASGASQAAIVREQLIGAAAAGQLGPLRERLSEYLTAGEDLPEICEAYVVGCLSNYRLDEALRILDLWQSDFPRDPRPRLLRGRYREHRSDYNRAASEFLEAWKLSPNYAPAAYNLARICSIQKKNDEAEHWYQLAAKSLSEPRPALIGEARCLRESGRFESAHQVLKAAIKNQTTSARISDAYRIVGEPVETAAAQFDAELGQLELEEGNYAAACASFSKAIAANPRDWRTRYSYSIALRKTGETAQADLEVERVEAAKKALDACDLAIDAVRQNPQDVEARYIIGAAVLDHVSENQGIIWLNSVLAIDPRHREAHRKLADFYASNISRHPEFAKQAEWHRQQSGN